MMPNLNNFSDEELLAELDRRERQRSTAPFQQEFPDFTGLRKACAYYINLYAEEGYGDYDDEKHYIYEEALKAIYGDDIFKWISSHD